MLWLGGSTALFAGLDKAGAAGGAVVGVTVSITLLLEELWVAVIVTLVVVETALVETVNLARLLPCGIDTLAGTVATAVLLLRKETTAPPGRAVEVNVTSPCEELPPWTLGGLTLSMEIPAPALKVRTSDHALKFPERSAVWTRQ